MSSYPFISLSPDPHALWFLWTSKSTKMHCHGDNCWMTLLEITELTGYSTVPYFIIWLGYQDISLFFLSGKHTIIYTTLSLWHTLWEIVNLTILPTPINDLCGFSTPPLVSASVCTWIKCDLKISVQYTFNTNY